MAFRGLWSDGRLVGDRKRVDVGAEGPPRPHEPRRQARRATCVEVPDLGVQRIRVGGMAELSGFNLGLNQDRRATLEMVTKDLFPGGDLPQASFWTGLRPMTPDSTPIIGGTRYKNLFLNTGHGTLGWTMACGSGKLISDLVMQQQPEISTEGLSLQRYAA